MAGAKVPGREGGSGWGRRAMDEQFCAGQLADGIWLLVPAQLSLPGLSHDPRATET